MQNQIRDKLNQLIDKWRGLEKSQKIKLISIIVILLLSLIATIYFVTKPKLEMLYTNLELGETAQIQEALKSMNIHYKTVDNGKTIFVKAEDLDQAKVNLSSEGVPKIESTFADAINLMGMGTTETVKREVIQRQTEADLSRIIRSIEGVKNAEVQIFVPNEENAFMKSNQKSNASVLLTLTHPLSNKQVEGIALLLTKSIQGLDLNDVVIIDQNSNTLYAAGQDGFNVNGQIEIEQIKKKSLEDDAKRILEPLYGEVRVQANVKLDWDEIQTIEKTYTPHVEGASTGLISEKITDSSAAENTTVGEEPGLAENGGDIPQYVTGENGPSSAERDIAETRYLYDMLETNRKTTGNNYLTEQSSISVMVYNIRLIDETTVREQGLLDNTSWEDYKATTRQQLVPLEIPPENIEAIRTGTGIDRVSVYGYEIPEFIDSLPEAPRPIENYFALAILTALIALLAFALIRKTSPADITEIEPDLEIEKLLVSSKDEEEKSQEVQQIDYSADSELKQLIDKFVEDNPEAVAQLLRNWLNDEWEW